MKTTSISLTWDAPETWHKGHEYEQVVHTSQVVDTGVRDAKGRVCGSYAQVGERKSGGVWIRIWATRDGDKFGAIPRESSAPSIEAAKATAAKKVAQAQARFARAAAKGEGRQWAKKA